VGDEPANGGGSGHGGHPAGGHGGGSDGTIVIPEAINRDLDIVFVVDNSSAMAKVQTNLINSFSAFAETLQAFPGGMPNLHLAVVSSDMGGGSGTSGCDGNGQTGLFQWGAPNAACTATKDGARFLSNINGEANYTGDLASVF